MTCRFFIRARLLAVAAVLFSLQVAVPAGAQEPSDVMAELRDRYDQISTLRAYFTQTMRMPHLDSPQTTEGTIELQGDRYRVSTDDQTIVANGETTWIHMHYDNQVLINDYEEDETSFSPTNFFLQFDERYVPQAAEATTMEGQPFTRLELESDDPATMFTRITIWVRHEDDMVHRIDVVDVNETEITFELSDVELNPDLGEEVFVFTPPEDAEVIDLRT